MKIFVKVKVGAKENKVEKISDSDFKVSVKARPQEGRANSVIIKTLAEYFKISPSCISLISGFSSRQKTFEVL